MVVTFPPGITVVQVVDYGIGYTCTSLRLPHGSLHPRIVQEVLHHGITFIHSPVEGYAPGQIVYALAQELGGSALVGTQTVAYVDLLSPRCVRLYVIPVLALRITVRYAQGVYEVSHESVGGAAFAETDGVVPALGETAVEVPVLLHHDVRSRLVLGIGDGAAHSVGYGNAEPPLSGHQFAHVQPGVEVEVLHVIVGGPVFRKPLESGHLPLETQAQVGDFPCIEGQVQIGGISIEGLGLHHPYIIHPDDARYRIPRRVYEGNGVVFDVQQIGRAPESIVVPHVYGVAPDGVAVHVHDFLFEAGNRIHVDEYLLPVGGCDVVVVKVVIQAVLSEFEPHDGIWGEGGRAGFHIECNLPVVGQVVGPAEDPVRRVLHGGEYGGVCYREGVLVLLSVVRVFQSVEYGSGREVLRICLIAHGADPYGARSVRTFHQPFGSLEGHPVNEEGGGGSEATVPYSGISNIVGGRVAHHHVWLLEGNPVELPSIVFINRLVVLQVYDEGVEIGIGVQNLAVDQSLAVQTAIALRPYGIQVYVVIIVSIVPRHVLIVVPCHAIQPRILSEGRFYYTVSVRVLGVQLSIVSLNVPVSVPPGGILRNVESHIYSNLALVSLHHHFYEVDHGEIPSPSVQEGGDAGPVLVRAGDLRAHLKAQVGHHLIALRGGRNRGGGIYGVLRGRAHFPHYGCGIVGRVQRLKGLIHGGTPVVPAEQFDGQGLGNVYGFHVVNVCESEGADDGETLRILSAYGQSRCSGGLVSGEFEEELIHHGYIYVSPYIEFHDSGPASLLPYGGIITAASHAPHEECVPYGESFVYVVCVPYSEYGFAPQGEEAPHLVGDVDGGVGVYVGLESEFTGRIIHYVIPAFLQRLAIHHHPDASLQYIRRELYHVQGFLPHGHHVVETALVSQQVVSVVHGGVPYRQTIARKGFEIREYDVSPVEYGVVSPIRALKGGVHQVVSVGIQSENLEEGPSILPIRVYVGVIPVYGHLEGRCGAVESDVIDVLQTQIPYGPLFRGGVLIHEGLALQFYYLQEHGVPVGVYVPRSSSIYSHVIDAYLVLVIHGDQHLDDVPAHIEISAVPLQFVEHAHLAQGCGICLVAGLCKSGPHGLVVGGVVVVEEYPEDDNRIGLPNVEELLLLVIPGIDGVDGCLPAQAEGLALRLPLLGRHDEGALQTRESHVGPYAEEGARGGAYGKG